MKSNNVVIVFAKEPVAGKVKTRLTPFLGEQGCGHYTKTVLENLQIEKL